jgi:3-deoxy-manno-octulosonate cytidylyltransferase (CMP-KDO synthetase)
MAESVGMRTVIAIPARFGSVRLPGKPLLPIGGEPMVVRVWRRCLLVPGVERVLVATDDERIRAVVVQAGGEAVMTSSSHESGTDRVAEAVREVECDVVINVQGDEPFVEPEAIMKAANLLEDRMSPPVGTLACAVRSAEELTDPAVVKVVVGEDGHALYFSRLPIPFRQELWVNRGQGWKLSATASAAEIEGYYRHVGVYAFRRDFLQEYSGMETTAAERSEKLEQLRILERGEQIGVAVTDYCGRGVDTEEGLEYARRRAEEEG